MVEPMRESDKMLSADRSISTTTTATPSGSGSFERLVQERVLRAYIGKQRHSSPVSSSSSVKQEPAIKKSRVCSLDFNIRVPRKPRTPRVEVTDDEIEQTQTQEVNNDKIEQTQTPEVKDDKIEQSQTQKVNDDKIEQSRTQNKRKIEACDCVEEKEEQEPNIEKRRRVNHNPPPDLPQKFKDLIRTLGGTNVKLVVQKPITLSDTAVHLGRLTIPNKQIIERDFVSERNFRRTGCSLIQPCLEIRRDLRFNRWRMGNSFVYALMTNWMKVFYYERNQLEVGSTVQLWSFRVGPELWFAMVKLPDYE